MLTSVQPSELARSVLAVPPLALRKDLEERQRKGPVRTEFNSVNLPFAASHLTRHRFTLAGPDPKEPHRLRLRFEPRADTSPSIHKGEALVDPSTGQLIRLSYSPSELPTMAHRVDVRMDFRPHPGVGQVLDMDPERLGL